MKQHTIWVNPIVFLNRFLARYFETLQSSWWQVIGIPIRNVFWPGDFDLWPMTLTFKVDLDVLPLDLHAKTQVCLYVSPAVRMRQTDRHTDKMVSGVKIYNFMVFYGLKEYNPPTPKKLIFSSEWFGHTSRTIPESFNWIDALFIELFIITSQTICLVFTAILLAKCIIHLGNHDAYVTPSSPHSPSASRDWRHLWSLMLHADFGTAVCGGLETETGRRHGLSAII